MGCATTHKNSDRFPAVIRDICERAEADAKARIISIGAKPLNLKPRVYLTPGTRSFNGTWGVPSSRTSTGWSGGWASGSNIHIVHNPANQRDIDYESLVHEFGEVFVGGASKHPAWFRDVFKNWN